MRAHEQLNDARDCAVLAQWSLVVDTQRQVADQADHGLDERPATGWVQQLDQHWEAVVQSHGVLRHLGVGVATGQVSERADGRLGDVLAVARLHDGAHERLDAAHLTHRLLVLGVVARQVGQDARRTRHDVDVIRRQQLHERAQQWLDTLLQKIIALNVNKHCDIFCGSWNNVRIALQHRTSYAKSTSSSERGVHFGG